MGHKARSLRTRLAWALTGLSVGAAVAVSLAFWGAEKYLEEDSQRRLLERSELGPDHPAARALIAYSDNLAERRDRWLVALTSGGIVLVGLAGWWFSGRLARATLKPFDELVGQIGGLDAEVRGGPRLLHSDDPDLQVIVGALNAHMSQLDAVIQRERAFASAASHELRTPLNVIGGASAVLSASSAAPAHVLGRIDRAVFQARRDLEALLALSRPTEPAPTQLLRVEPLLREVAAMHTDEGSAAAASLIWRVPGDLALPLNAGALSIVFGNLLRNSLRAARGGEIVVEADAHRVVVSDSGPGFPPEVLGATPHPLGARADGGSGLGLYIAHVLAGRQGWRLVLGAGPAGGARAELLFGAQVP